MKLLSSMLTIGISYETSSVTVQAICWSIVTVKYFVASIPCATLQATVESAIQAVLSQADPETRSRGVGSVSPKFKPAMVSDTDPAQIPRYQAQTYDKMTLQITETSHTNWNQVRIRTFRMKFRFRAHLCLARCTCGHRAVCRQCKMQCMRSMSIQQPARQRRLPLFCCHLFPVEP